MVDGIAPDIMRRKTNVTKSLSEAEKSLIANVKPEEVEWSYSLQGCHFHTFNTNHLDKYNSIHFGLLGPIEIPQGRFVDIDDLSPVLRMSLIRDFLEKKRCVVVLGCSKKITNDSKLYCTKGKTIVHTLLTGNGVCGLVISSGLSQFCASRKNFCRFSSTHQRTLCLSRSLTPGNHGLPTSRHANHLQTQCWMSIEERI